MILSNARSLVMWIMRNAGNALRKWADELLWLQEIITAKDLVSQVDVRLMASVYFKNSINRYWRNRRDYS